MRVLHAISSIRRKAGDPVVAISGLVSQLQAAGCEIDVLATFREQDDLSEADHLRESVRADMHYCLVTLSNLDNSGWMRAREMGKALIERGIQVSYIVDDNPVNRKLDRLHPQASIEWISRPRSVGQSLRRLAHLRSRLRHAHVLLFPIRDTLVNRTRCPSKTFAYAQAMRPIITCKVGEVAQVLGDQAIYVPATPEAFADAIEAAMERADLNDVDYHVERQNWQDRAERLLKLIGTPQPPQVQQRPGAVTN